MKFPEAVWIGPLAAGVSEHKEFPEQLVGVVKLHVLPQVPVCAFHEQPLLAALEQADGVVHEYWHCITQPAVPATMQAGSDSHTVGSVTVVQSSLHCRRTGSHMQSGSAWHVALSRYLYRHFLEQLVDPNWHIWFAAQSCGEVIRPHVAWHMPRATLHMHLLFASHVVCAVYAYWHCFWHTPLFSSHCGSAMQSAVLIFMEQRRLHRFSWAFHSHIGRPAQSTSSAVSVQAIEQMLRVGSNVHVGSALHVVALDP